MSNFAEFQTEKTFVLFDQNVQHIDTNNIDISVEYDCAELQTQYEQHTLTSFDHNAQYLEASSTDIGVDNDWQELRIQSGPHTFVLFDQNAQYIDANNTNIGVDNDWQELRIQSGPHTFVLFDQNAQYIDTNNTDNGVDNDCAELQSQNEQHTLTLFDRNAQCLDTSNTDNVEDNDSPELHSQSGPHTFVLFDQNAQYIETNNTEPELEAEPDLMFIEKQRKDMSQTDKAQCKLHQQCQDAVFLEDLNEEDAVEQTKCNENPTPLNVNIKPRNGCDNTVMIVPTSHCGSNKKLCCMYCHKRYSKLARHLQTVHKHEEDVKKFRDLPTRMETKKKKWKPKTITKGSVKHFVLFPVVLSTIGQTNDFLAHVFQLFLHNRNIRKDKRCEQMIRGLHIGERVNISNLSKSVETGWFTSSRKGDLEKIGKIVGYFIRLYACSVGLAIDKDFIPTLPPVNDTDFNKLIKSLKDDKVIVPVVMSLDIAPNSAFKQFSHLLTHLSEEEMIHIPIEEESIVSRRIKLIKIPATMHDAAWQVLDTLEAKERVKLIRKFVQAESSLIVVRNGDQCVNNMSENRMGFTKERIIQTPSIDMVPSPDVQNETGPQGIPTAIDCGNEQITDDLPQVINQEQRVRLDVVLNDYELNSIAQRTYNEDGSALQQMAPFDPTRRLQKKFEHITNLTSGSDQPETIGLGSERSPDSSKAKDREAKSVYIVEDEMVTSHQMSETREETSMEEYETKYIKENKDHISLSITDEDKIIPVLFCSAEFLNDNDENDLNNPNDIEFATSKCQINDTKQNTSKRHNSQSEKAIKRMRLQPSLELNYSNLQSNEQNKVNTSDKDVLKEFENLAFGPDTSEPPITVPQQMRRSIRKRNSTIVAPPKPSKKASVCRSLKHKYLTRSMRPSSVPHNSKFHWVTLEYYPVIPAYISVENGKSYAQPIVSSGELCQQKYANFKLLSGVFDKPKIYERGLKKFNQIYGKNLK